MEENNSKKRISRKEQSASNKKEKKERGARPKKRWGLRILGAFGTLILVGVLTASMFVWIFMKYVDTSLRGHVEVDLSEYTQEVSTELYYKDPSTGEWFMYQTLFANENRIWIDSEDIPEYLKNATIAIEDKRFKTHEGVDWKGTLRGIVYTGGTMLIGAYLPMIPMFIAFNFVALICIPLEYVLHMAMHFARYKEVNR